MRQVGIEEAQTNLSSLVDEAAAGEPVIISKAGRAVAKLVAVDAVKAGKRPVRLGSLDGQFKIPDDFDRMAEQEIATLFGVKR